MKSTAAQQRVEDELPGTLDTSRGTTPLGYIVSLTRILAWLVATIVGSQSAVAETPTTPLELMVLGSGGPGALGRASSCYLVLIDGKARILVEAGPGAFARLGEAKLSLSDTDIVLLSARAVVGF